MTRHRPAPPAALGVGSDRFPLAKATRWGAGIVAVGALIIAGVIQVDREQQRREDEQRRAACVVVDPAVTVALLATVDSRADEVARGAGAAIGPGGDAAWLVSVEVGPPDLSDGALVEVLTWALPDRGGSPEPAGARAVDRLARERSSLEPADTLLVTVPGGVESRWCAKDASSGIGA